MAKEKVIGPPPLCATIKLRIDLGADYSLKEALDLLTESLEGIRGYATAEALVDIPVSRLKL